MNVPKNAVRKPLIVLPDHGRKYDMGRMRAIFFADGEETDSRYSISEWWLEPRTPGPGTHSHTDDHIFYVLAGALSLYIEDKWTDAPRGTYALIPGGIAHNFENRGTSECGFISINTPAGFEKMMPAIVNWFAENPLGVVT
ncbi:MAG: cupin domain-containing protein [Pseudomonadota bacterium]